MYGTDCGSFSYLPFKHCCVCLAKDPGAGRIPGYCCQTAWLGWGYPPVIWDALNLVGISWKETSSRLLDLWCCKLVWAQTRFPLDTVPRSLGYICPDGLISHLWKAISILPHAQVPPTCPRWPSCWSIAPLNSIHPPGCQLQSPSPGFNHLPVKQRNSSRCGCVCVFCFCFYIFLQGWLTSLFLCGV